MGLKFYSFPDSVWTLLCHEAVWIGKGRGEAFPGEMTAGCWHGPGVPQSIPETRTALFPQLLARLGALIAMSSESLISVRCADFCCQNLGLWVAFALPALPLLPACAKFGVWRSLVWWCWQSQGDGGAGCAFLPHTKKPDLPQLIDKIYFSWCTAVLTIIFYLSLHCSFSRSPPSPHCPCFVCALPGSGSGFCSNSCLL